MLAVAEVSFGRANVQAEPAERWQRFVSRAGEKEPLQVEALTARLQTRQDNRLGPEERLRVVRAAGTARPDRHKTTPVKRLQ